MRNCPNCGAPIEPYKCKCEFCGSLYFDFTSLSMTSNTPCFVKFHTPFGIITTLAKPELKTIDTSVESTDIENGRGNVIHRIVTSVNCDIDITFHTVMNPDNNSLYTIEFDKKQENYGRFSNKEE